MVGQRLWALCRQHLCHGRRWGAGRRKVVCRGGCLDAFVPIVGLSHLQTPRSLALASSQLLRGASDRKAQASITLRYRRSYLTYRWYEPEAR